MKRWCLFFLGFGVLLWGTPLGAFSAILSERTDGTPRLLYRVPDLFIERNEEGMLSAPKAILADLDAMELTLYAHGKPLNTFPILSKGRRGTPWETPSGSYQVLFKKEKHFSSLGHVYMPWSMQFYGNFFIHGWPYDLKGNDVPTGYSGGCIRLSTDDAKIVYAFAEKGTLVEIKTSPGAVRESGGYYLSQTTLPPELSAEHVMALDLDRAQILWRERATETTKSPLPSKFLAALASLEAMNQYIPRPLDWSEELPENLKHLEAIDALPAQALIAPMLYSHGTSIEEIFATEYGSRGFLRLMNEKAMALGMTRTQIIDLGGFETKNTGSAEDMIRLLRAIYQSKPYLLSITKVASTTNGEEGDSALDIQNVYPISGWKAEYLGGIIDPESRSAMGIFRVSVGGINTRTVAIALMESANPKQDIGRIVDYLSQSTLYLPEEVDRVIEWDRLPLFTRIRALYQRMNVAEMLLGIEEQSSGLPIARYSH